MSRKEESKATHWVEYSLRNDERTYAIVREVVAEHEKEIKDLWAESETTGDSGAADEALKVLQNKIEGLFEEVALDAIDVDAPAVVEELMVSGLEQVDWYEITYGLLRPEEAHYPYFPIGRDPESG